MARVYVEERNDQDIRLVIEGQLEDIKPVERRRQIEKEILLKAHGGFQWAILITKMVLEEDMAGARTEDLLNIISTTPPDLDDLYDLILKGATKGKYKQMAKLFQWVLYAKRPLSAQELREALATDKDMPYATVSELRSHCNWSDSVSQFELRVRHISRGLVEFQNRDVYEQYELGGEEWSREAQFIHQSAADFVAQRFLTNIDERSSMSPPAAGHYEISRSFLRYLTLDEILNANDLSREKLSATFPLMPYGVTFLLDHVKGVEEGAICQADLVTLIQWNQYERLGMLARIWRIMDPEGTHAPRGWPFHGASVLHLAVAFASPSLLDELLQRDSSPLDATDVEENTPLQLAIREDYQDLALLILERSRAWQTEIDSVSSEDCPSGTVVPRKYLGHVNTFNLDGETPLSLAVSIKADSLIRALIDAGADVRLEKSLVFYAISQRDKELVSQLIKGGSKLEGAVFFATQCLLRTKDGDQELLELFKDLLGAGANTRRFTNCEIDDYFDFDELEGEDAEDEEAIFVASRAGKTTLVTLLVSHSSSATMRDQSNKVPILVAIENEQFDIAISLFRNSPRTVFLADNEGLTALDSIIFRALVDLAYSFVEESKGTLALQRFLYRAIDMKQLPFVDDLLEFDPDNIEMVNQSWGERDTPFLEAVKRMDDNMVELFLRREETDPRVRAKDGKTPFFLAIQLGSLTIAKLLLNTGNPASKPESFEGVGSFARSIIDAFRDMVKVLYGSDPGGLEWHPGRFQKCLWWTIKSGNLRMLRFLLCETMVDINQAGYERQPPLFWAIRSGNEGVIKVLLDSGKVSFHGEMMWKSPFGWAMDMRRNGIIEMLLGSDSFDLHMEGDVVRRRLLSWAIENEKGHIIQLMVDSAGLEILPEDDDIDDSRSTVESHA
ncbi:hypothetical protein J7337_013827 [Fusarium musae]|uniref:Ankyrin n=1 Tax=Fusarium musae TaxID=1042133 RepID=A0A9P8IIK6_9HYPO|nr:hypothetical protein J7337_013827 [Fusarium musae]KAG9495577.1 hypothetical protein J7337_013827 [Fusarium musae]